GTMKSDNLNAIAAAELYLMDNPTPEGGNVLLSDILGTTSGTSYLDDTGSLEDFTYNKDSKKVISNAVQGAMKLDITGDGATKSDINSFKNSDRDKEGSVIKAYKGEETDQGE